MYPHRLKKFWESTSMNDSIKRFCVGKDITVADAMQSINIGSKGILFVTDVDDKLIGCVTDGDIRRWLLKTADFNASISRFMSIAPKYLRRGQAKQARQFMLENSITAVPIVDREKKIIDIIYLNELPGSGRIRSSALKTTPVVIMAGGKGTRLYPYTKILPKPLIPVGDIPILERIINRFCEAGAQEFFISVNYKRNMIKSYFGEDEHPYTIEYIDEDIPLGTCGSIRLIQKQFDKPFIVTNCDTLIDVDFGDLMSYHLSSQNLITVVAALKNTTIPYGVFEIGENGTIENIKEKPVISHLINTGMYVVNPELIPLIPENIMFHMPDLLEKVRQQNGKIGLFPVNEDAFLDMGEFAEMKRMEEKLRLVEG